MAPRRARDLAPGWLVHPPDWHAYLLCGDGDGCGLLVRPRPGGVLPALLVGDGEELGLAVGDGVDEREARWGVLPAPGALVPGCPPLSNFLSLA